MGRKVSTIPKAPVGRMLMNAGAKRVSQDAVDTFTEILMQEAERVARKSAEISKHAGRKTVHEGDVKLAAKQ